MTFRRQPGGRRGVDLGWRGIGHAPKVRARAWAGRPAHSGRGRAAGLADGPRGRHELRPRSPTGSSSSSRARPLRWPGENATIVSLDRITCEPSDGGTRVTYDADLVLKGPLRIADP